VVKTLQRGKCNKKRGEEKKESWAVWENGQKKKIKRKDSAS